MGFEMEYNDRMGEEDIVGAEMTSDSPLIRIIDLA
jgi:hypothetical protein